MVELAPSSSSKPTFAEEARFVLRLGAEQLRHADSWWLFNHVGIARAQTVIPPFIRRRYAVLLCGVEAWDPALSTHRKTTLRSASARIAISRLTARRTNVTLPYVVELADRGWRAACVADASLAAGLSTSAGALLSAPVAEAHGLPCTTLDLHAA